MTDLTKLLNIYDELEKNRGYVNGCTNLRYYKEYTNKVVELNKDFSLNSAKLETLCNEGNGISRERLLYPGNVCKLTLEFISKIKCPRKDLDGLKITVYPWFRPSNAYKYPFMQTAFELQVKNGKFYFVKAFRDNTQKNVHFVTDFSACDTALILKKWDFDKR